MNISPNSIPMYFALSALFLFLAAVIQRLNQFYSLPQHKTFKHVAIDGLRGFLALGVFFHHSLINYNYIATGVWTTPNSRFYTMLGQLSVGLFFAITAFLFWSKVLDSRDGINWKTLYVSRVRRIMPMYLVSVVIVIVFTLVLAYSENVALFSTVESFVGMCKQFAKYLFFGSPSLPIQGAFTLNAGVFWTLIWEWKFYISLPFLAVFSKTYKPIFIFLLFLFCACSEEKFLYFFLTGILCAEFQHKKMCQYAYKFKLVLDFIFLLCLFVLFCFFDTAYGIIQALLTVAVFFCLINGNGFFGLLNTKAARILGEMSFSVYLLHGLIITAVNSLLPSHSFHVQNYWIITLSTGFTVILLSSLTYQLIECRFYKNHLGVAQN